jgi:hypothetical protein
MAKHFSTKSKSPFLISFSQKIPKPFANFDLPIYNFGLKNSPKSIGKFFSNFVRISHQL